MSEVPPPPPPLLPPEDASCPICDDEMHSYDRANPLQCSTTNCQFNICLTCIENMIKATENELEASDGNTFRLSLLCPSCRSDLGPSIRDTVRLRKVDARRRLKSSPDVKLSSKQLQQKYWKEENALSNNGARNKSKDNGEQPAIDVSLFGGLEFAMSEEEQMYVTKLMTSGYPSQLCQAAQILSGTADLLRRGKTPSIRNSPSPNNAASRKTLHATNNRRNGYSSHAGIRANRSHEESNFQRQMEIKAREKLRRPLPARMPLCVTLGTGEFEQMAHLARLKANSIQVEKPWWRSLLEKGTGGRAIMTFVDDEWDGTIADAFARVRIGSAATSSGQLTVQARVGPKNPVEQMSIEKILSIGGKGELKENNQLKKCHRVLVGTVGGEAGKAGIMKGDVVTHVNGEVFTGNASDLNDFLVSAYEQQGSDGIVMIVVNAEACTAEALRLRSKIR